MCPASSGAENKDVVWGGAWAGTSDSELPASRNEYGTCADDVLVEPNEEIPFKDEETRFVEDERATFGTR
jgi:hypothetical protein